MRFLLAVCIGLCSPAVGQVVSIGPPDPDYCLKVERIKPNLRLTHTTDVMGRIADETGAPLKNSAVELRRYVSATKQVLLKTVKTDADGRFEITAVAQGQYRLLASPNRGFRQPEELDCGPAKRCFLTIKLKVNPSDLPESVCPVR